MFAGVWEALMGLKTPSFLKYLTPPRCTDFLMNLLCLSSESLDYTERRGWE